MADYFSSDPPNILLCKESGIGYKSTVKVKFSAQPMHQIYVINYFIVFLEGTVTNLAI